MVVRRFGFGAKPHLGFVAPYIFPVLSCDRAATFVGGAEVQQSFLVRGLRDAGFQVTVAANATGWPDEFEMEGIRIVKIIRQGREIPIVRNIHPRLTSIWDALRRADADVYYQRCAGADTLVASLFSRRYGRRFIYSGASDPDFERDQTWKKFPGRGGWRDRQMYQWGLRLADGIVAQHRGQVEACRRWYGREAVEIPNCYAPPPGATVSRDGVVLWVGTVKSLKRPELFLKLARSLPQLRFRMIGGRGEGKEAEVYEKIKTAAALLPNVEFVGFVPFAEVEAHFNEARLFVNTSGFEGFPNTFLQSWARGIPTVSFVNCGAREGGRSIEFVCKDLAEMEVAVLGICEDDAAWGMEGQRVQRYFEANHSVARAVECYSRLFEQVLASKGGG